ncbi:MAG: urea amidolyase [Nevskia sp.]|nr:urea amidolyase [Nevskia sp.]
MGFAVFLLVYIYVLQQVHDFTIQDWQQRYREDGADPRALIGALVARCAGPDTAWILLLDRSALAAQFEQLELRLAAVGGDRTRLPLYGVPFAVKDNIDVVALPTTAACPAFAYVAAATAPAVQKLLDAGAILIGKTNLDQFATGLVGTRSPYGAVPNTFDARYISGGSSSGSASVVARGLVAFALGTDTAGSGRVPAGFNNLVGLKPTRGWLSSRGVVPACRSLDCISVFALTVDDAELVANIAAGYDDGDPYSRPAPATAASARLPQQPRFGIPQSPQWYGDKAAEAAYQQALTQMQALGATLVPLDFSPLFEIAALLYEGPWLAERYAAIEDFIREQAEQMHPVVRTIIERARGISAIDAFKAEYRRAELVRSAQHLLRDVDALLTPTAPTISTIAEVEADPITLNARLGTYTNFVNLLDWCALALPAGFRSDGLPNGIALIAPSWRDAALTAFGRRWQAHAPWPLGATGATMRPATTASAAIADSSLVRVAVVGAHLSGMPLNGQLSERKAAFVETTTTSTAYRLYALPGTVPPKPGLAKTGEGAAIEVELWDVPVENFGSFVALIPAPLGIGTLELADGRLVKGFICEGWAIPAARDITEFGGWRAFLAASNTATAKE